MRSNTPLLTFVTALLLAPAAAYAQEATNDQPDRPNRTERRERMIAAYDADGDGQLSDEERAKAREELGERRGRPDRQGGDRNGRGPRADGPPDSGQLFDRFDENNDDQLSREEFMKLTAAMREMRERRGGGPPGARGRADRDDRPGPPRDGGDRPQRRRGDVGEGDRFRPLENQGPGSRDDQRGYRGPDSDRGAGQRRGYRERDPERRGPPNPERLFNAFDANDDDQLSREEFMQLMASMREMRQRMAGMRDRGNRPGPPGDGERGRFRGPDRPEGPPRPPRPPRPEFESADPPMPDADDNSQ